LLPPSPRGCQCSDAGPSSLSRSLFSAFLHVFPLFPLLLLSVLKSFISTFSGRLFSCSFSFLLAVIDPKAVAILPPFFFSKDFGDHPSFFSRFQGVLLGVYRPSPLNLLMSFTLLSRSFDYLPPHPRGTKCFILSPCAVEFSKPQIQSHESHSFFFPPSKWCMVGLPLFCLMRSNPSHSSISN